MRKLIIGLLTALLMGGALIGVSEGAAQATCPYTGCVATHTRVHVPSKPIKGHRAHICVRVRTGGNGWAKGRVTLRVTRPAGGYHYLRSHRYTPSRHHARTCFTTKRLRKVGRYVAKASYHAQEGSAFVNSHSRARLHVVRHR